jgi:hypothetical protein
MLGQKKRNPDPPKGGEDNTEDAKVLTPASIPPLRTFRLQRYDGHDDIIEAHGLGIDESRMLSFVIFFFVDGDLTKPAQAQKLVLNADGWLEVEEINVAFPVLEKH